MQGSNRDNLIMWRYFSSRRALTFTFSKMEDPRGVVNAEII